MVQYPNRKWMLIKSTDFIQISLVVMSVCIFSSLQFYHMCRFMWPLSSSARFLCTSLLYTQPPMPLPHTWLPWFFSPVHNFVISRILCVWNHIVCVTFWDWLFFFLTHYNPLEINLRAFKKGFAKKVLHLFHWASCLPLSKKGGMSTTKAKVLSYPVR